MVVESYAASLVSGSGLESIQLLLHHLFESPHHAQVWVNVTLFLPIENLLTIEVHLEPAIRARGDTHSNVTAKRTEKLVRHPRGGRVMFSRDAVNDIHESFPFRSHQLPSIVRVICFLHHLGTPGSAP